MDSLDQSHIYVLCPCINLPNEGVRQLYHHVELLNRTGFRAFITHSQQGFALTWFAHRAPVVYVQDIRLRNNDFLVVPSDAGPDMARIASGYKKVIYNQDCYRTFEAFPANQQELRVPYLERDFIATLVRSDDSKAYLEYAFPRHKVYRIHPSIDPSLFNMTGAKKRLICYASGRNPEDGEQVIHMLRHRNALCGFDIIAIDGSAPDEAAATMREAVLFLSFGHQEGFGLPAAQAMACGCVVVGHHGYGGKEFFRPEFSCPVAAGDVVNYARITQELIATYDRSPEQVMAMGREASRFISRLYTEEQEEKDTVAAWTELMNYSEMAYYFHDSDTVIMDFAEFSNEDIRTIEARMNDFHEFTGDEWNRLPEPDYAGKARAFYASSKFYIYDLLTANFNKQTVIDKLNNFSPMILETIRNHPGRKFLEYGGGLGVFCEIIHGMGKEVTYLDIPGMVSEFAAWRFKRYHFPINIVLTDPEIFDLRNCYDIIYSDAVLEHTINPEQIVRLLCDRLNPDGLFILLVDLSGPSEMFPMHRHVAIQPLHQLMREQGLAPIQGEGTFCSLWRKAGVKG